MAELLDGKTPPYWLLDHPWVAVVLFIALGLGICWMCAGPLVPWLDRRKEPDKKRSQVARHESDRWSGHCYRCGSLVHPGAAVSVHQGSRPPKYFCPDCRPFLG